jgi:hypothetical protein
MENKPDGNDAYRRDDGDELRPEIGRAGRLQDHEPWGATVTVRVEL